MLTAAKKLSIVIICLFFLFSALFTFIFYAPDSVSYADDSSVGWADGTFTSLNTGIYWYHSGSEVPVKAGTEGAVFDPEKPTVIFAHGLKKEEGYNKRDVLTLWGNTNSYFEEEGFDFFEFDENFYQKYIDTGYNVGHFYWSQLSDDEVTCDVKIWSSNTEMGMRYFVSNTEGKRVQGDPAFNPTKSVALLFGDALIEALGNSYSKDIQLIGHSMGGQLVLATSEYLVESCKAGKIGHNLVPKRVTLLDPYFGMSSLDNCTVDHLNKSCEDTLAARLASDAMASIADFGIAVDAYSANDVFICRLYKLVYGKLREEEVDAITKSLTDNCAWVHLNALQNLYTTTKTHCMVVDYYFSTLYEQPKTDNTGNPVPYALSDVETLKSLRGCGYIQESANEDNPFYMHNSSFVRADSDIKVIDTKTNNLGIICGILENNNSAVELKLYDADGNFVTGDRLSTTNEYHFYGLAKGAYTVKAYNNAGKEIGLENNILTLNENQILTASVKSTNIEILPKKNLNWLWITLGVIGAVLIALTVAFLIVKKQKSNIVNSVETDSNCPNNDALNIDTADNNENDTEKP